MVQTVIDADEVSLDSIRYKVEGTILLTLPEGFGEKIILGDYTQENLRRRNTIRWNDLRGGIGLETVSPQDGRVELTRCYFSDCHILTKGHITLGNDAIALTGDPSGVHQAIAFFNGQLYLVSETANQSTFRTSTSSDNFTDTTHNLAGGVTVVDTATGRLSGTDYLIWGVDGGGYEFSSDGVSYTVGGREGHFLELWDGRLWGFDVDDYRIQATSPLIDSGKILRGVAGVIVDIEGRDRPPGSNDVGCYQYGVGNLGKLPFHFNLDWLAYINFCSSLYADELEVEEVAVWTEPSSELVGIDWSNVDLTKLDGATYWAYIKVGSTETVEGKLPLTFDQILREQSDFKEIHKWDKNGKKLGNIYESKTAKLYKETFRDIAPPVEVKMVYDYDKIDESKVDLKLFNKEKGYAESIEIQDISAIDSLPGFGLIEGMISIFLLFLGYFGIKIMRRKK